MKFVLNVNSFLHDRGSGFIDIEMVLSLTMRDTD